MPRVNKKWLVVLGSFAVITLLFHVQSMQNKAENVEFSQDYFLIQNEDSLHNGKWRNLREIEKSSLSKLGRILYLDEIPPAINESERTYQIMVWKYGEAIHQRHFKHFTNTLYDPLEKCSVKNCNITYKEAAIDSADLVIFHLHRTKGLSDLPKGPRKTSQIWAFLTDESPPNTLRESKEKLPSFNGIFNWSMTYKMDADIPVPYGRTVARKVPLLHRERPWKKKRRDVLVTILGSNCGSLNKRWEYVKELQKHIKVDVYGSCGPLKCPGHFKQDCSLIDQYIFYLAFENCDCKDYVTEKLWWNAYWKNSIPIVMGSFQTLETLLPPNSYINIQKFAKPADLAEYILYLNKTNDFDKFYTWKHNFEVLNEHGYFQSPSFHYCRACEALNYNKRNQKIYNHLETYFSKQNDCTPPWNAR